MQELVFNHVPNFIYSLNDIMFHHSIDCYNRVIACFAYPLKIIFKQIQLTMLVANNIYCAFREPLYYVPILK